MLKVDRMLAAMPLINESMCQVCGKEIWENTTQTQKLVYYLGSSSTSYIWYLCDECASLKIDAIRASLRAEAAYLRMRAETLDTMANEA